MKSKKHQPNLIHGETLKQHYCICCKAKIGYNCFMKGSKKCKICSHKGKKFNNKHRKNLSISMKNRMKNPENNPNYIDGRTLLKKYCKDCNKEINYKSIRCFKCAMKYRIVHNHNKKCIDCNKKIYYTNNRCKKCYFEFKKINKQIYKCKRCNNLISQTSANFGGCLCRKCADYNHSKKMKGKGNPRYGKVAHGRWGSYKGIKMRSSYELNFAKFLTLSGIKWKYEPKTFDLGNTTYTPDFYLPEFDCYIEVKGYWRDDAKEKFEKFKKLYPKLNIELFNGNNLKRMSIIEN